jgi:hypothetical protein
MTHHPSSSQMLVSPDSTFHGPETRAVTAELRNAGGESPPQMKTLNYHAINMQTSAKLGLNQISHWGLSGGGESGRRGGVGTRGGLQGGGCGMKRRLQPGPRHLRAAPGLWSPQCLAWGLAPIEGSQGLRLQATVGRGFQACQLKSGGLH